MRSVVVASVLIVSGAVAGGCSSPATHEPWEAPGAPAGGSSNGTGSSSGNGGASGSGSTSSSGSSSRSGGSNGGGSSGAGSGDASSSGAPSSGSGSGSGGPSSGGDAGTGDASGGGGSGGGTDAGSASPFDPFQQHNLDEINQYRATLSLRPLVLDQTLSAFALAGSQELTQDHTPHQHFVDASNAGTLWSSGFTSSAGENQGDPNGWPQASSNPTTNELTQIDQIQKAMFDEGPGTGEAHGHYENMMSATFTRVGIGLIEVGGMLYLTNDFSN
jgi:uncharacterized protein YkwD